MVYHWYQSVRTWLCVVLLLVLAGQGAFAAASSTIRGRITDRDSKDALPGATVVVKGTSLGASTDLNGNFIIYNVPAGTQTLVASYVGYRQVTTQITVEGTGDLVRDFTLQVQAITGETVVVTAQAKGQAQAINQQLSSNSIVSIVSEAKIQELPDANAAEAIGRLPGISVMRSSGEADKVVIRGMAPQYNLVTINDITLGSTGKYDRSVDLTMISPYMLQSINVHKALTPDMEGNAIGGAVNMQLREAPAELHTDLIWQSGYTAKTKTYGNYKAMGSVSDRFFDNRLGVYALLNAEKYDRGADNFSANYSLRAGKVAGEAFSPVKVDLMTLDRHFDTRNRYGANLILDYKLPDGSISWVNMVSQLKSDYSDYNTQYEYVNKNLNFNFGNGLAKNTLGLSALQGKYDFGLVLADFSASLNFSRNYNPQQASYQFQDAGGILPVPQQVNTRPENLVSLAQFNPQMNWLQQVGYSNSDYKENDQAYALNFKLPFNLESIASGYVKLGGKYKKYARVNDEGAPYAQLRYQGNSLVQAVRAQNFPFLVYSPSDISFRATGVTNPDGSLLGSFLNDKYGNLIWAPDINPLNQLTNWIVRNASNDDRYYNGDFFNKRNDYGFDEEYYAGYAMAEFNVGPDLMIVGGARFEEDNSFVDAYYVQQQNNWRTEKAQVRHATPKNRFWLPMIQGRYNITDWMDVRYAYTQTVARPDFTQIMPYENSDQNGQGVNAGNPKLLPAQAFNHDVMLSFHSNDLGLLSVGAFYKTVEDFSYFIQYQLLKSNVIPGYDTQPMHPQAQVGATMSTFYNNPYKAFVKGLEVDLQTRFWYLPKPLDGLILGINYTHINSETNYPLLVPKNMIIPPAPRPQTVLTDSSRPGRLIFQPDDIANVMLGYDYMGFSARASFFFQGNMVSGIGIGVETDGFTRDYFRWDLTVRQKLPLEGLQLFLNMNNINQRTDISAQTTIGGSTSEQYYGLTAELGLRFTL